jgi:hypothetical protein
MAQRKDSPATPTKGGAEKAAQTGGGNAKSAGKGGGRSSSAGARTAAPNRNATTRREKASPSGRDRGETSVADRS